MDSEEVLLGPMAYRDPKGERDNRMLVNRLSCPGVWGGAPGIRVIWRKLDCLKPNLQWTESAARRKDTRRRQPRGGIVEGPLRHPGSWATAIDGI